MKIRIIGAPSAWGTLELGARRTPDALREAGLAEWLAAAGHEVDDAGDIEVVEQTAADVPTAESCAGSTELTHADEMAAMARNLRDAVAKAIGDGFLPIIVGGECSVSVGAVPALADLGEPITVAWLDAHADINTPETSTSGLATGMPLAALLGSGHDALTAIGADTDRPLGSATFLIGGRDIDPGEAANMAHFGVQHLDTAATRAVGPEEVAMTVLGVPEICVAPPEARAQMSAADPRLAAAMAAAPSSPLYVHFDVDVIDPEFAPGVHYRVAGGFDPSEVATLIGYLCASGRVGALSIASANLDHDVNGATVGAIRDVLSSVADALATVLPDN